MNSREKTFSDGAESSDETKLVLDDISGFIPDNGLIGNIGTFSQLLRDFFEKFDNLERSNQKLEARIEQLESNSKIINPSDIDPPTDEMNQSEEEELPEPLEKDKWNELESFQPFQSSTDWICRHNRTELISGDDGSKTFRVHFGVVPGLIEETINIFPEGFSFQGRVVLETNFPQSGYDLKDFDLNTGQFKLKTEEPITEIRYVDIVINMSD